MSKLFKWLFKILCLLLICVITLGVVLIINLSDDSNITNNLIIDNPKTNSMILNTRLQEGSKNVNDNEVCDFKLNEEDLEYLFNSIISNIEFSNTAFSFTGSNVDVIDERYTLQISGKFSSFKSVITSNIDLKEKDNSFIISLNTLKLGKVNLRGIGKTLLSFVDEKKLEENLFKANIYCTIDLTNLTISFSKENIQKMLLNSLKDSESYQLFDVLIDIILYNDNLLSFNLGLNNMLGFSLYLSSLKTTKTYDFSYDFEEIKNKCEQLLKNSIITYENVNYCFNYLVNGYNRIDDKTKQLIEKIDFSSVGIDNILLYEGIINNSVKDLSQIVNESINFTIDNVSSNNKFDIKISDSSLNFIIQNKIDFIGYSYAFTNANNNEIGYFVFEQINIICKENKLYLDLVCNLNNLKLFVEIEVNCKNENDGLKIIGTISTISLGNNLLTENQKNKLIKYFNNSFNKIDWISFDSLTNSVSIDMTNAFLSNQTINTIIATYTNSHYKTSIKDGYINIEFNII